MTTSRSRIVAGVLMATGGLFVAVGALAIGVARLIVDAGIPARPAELALLDDLVPVLPFVAGFAVVGLVAAVGLLGDRAWGSGVASGAAVIAVVVGVVGLVLVIAGSDPFVATAAQRASEVDGIGILGAFTGLYLAVLAALSIDRQPIRGGSLVAA